MYDSLTDDPPELNDSEEDKDEDYGADDNEEATAQQVRRVIVFATRWNIELLCESNTWFVEGTFKTSPSIFAQIFTIMGLRQRAGTTKSAVAIPLVYVLLSGKKQLLYVDALEVKSKSVNDTGLGTAHWRGLCLTLNLAL